MKINFGRLMLQAAKMYAEKEALVNVEKNRRFTFMELHLLTNRICNMMRDRFGLKEGDAYATLMENDNNSIFSLWLCKGQAAGLWMNYRDSFDEHMYQIDYVGPKVIFIETELLDRYYDALRQRGISIVCMDKPGEGREGLYYFWDLLEGVKPDETGVEYDYEKHITLFRFTGGTTGKGKCAMYTLRSFLDAVCPYYGHPENFLDDSVKFLHVAPITHGTILNVLPVFFKGGTNLTLNLPDLKKMCEVIQKEKVNATFVVPTLLYRLVDLGLEKMYDLSSLSIVLYGAAPMSPAKLEVLQEKFGNIFVQVYGSSEAIPPLVFLGKKDHIIRSEGDRTRLSSAGRALTGVELIIVDDSGKELPGGETGEIWVRGPSVVKGYYRDPDQTAEGFSPDGFWKSGDMGYLDERGYVYIVDRKKDMIVSGGFNVYAVEVENVINSHPAVQQSAVISVPHEDWGEAVHAEVILKENMEISGEELISYCKDKLGKYKVPKTVSFVAELPTSAVGKVLRRQVREKYWQGQKRRVN